MFDLDRDVERGFLNEEEHVEEKEEDDEMELAVELAVALAVALAVIFLTANKEASYLPDEIDSLCHRDRIISVAPSDSFPWIWGNKKNKNIKVKLYEEERKMKNVEKKGRKK